MKKNFVKSFIAFLLVVVMAVGLMPTALMAETPFVDVNPNAWYGNHVAYAYHHNLMIGTSATRFEPNATMTRAMMVKVLHNIVGNPTPSSGNPFRDVPANAWYTNAVIWAYQNGIVTGTEATRFAPDAPVTREQMVAIMYRFANYSGLNTNKSADLSQYNDRNKIDKYALDAFSWAVAVGVVEGHDAHTLDPNGRSTRAECAAVLHRYNELLTATPDPEPTEPKPTEPKPTEPKPTEPKPTEPKPTEPKPTEPKPTEPKPTEPKPTEPKPTEPKPTEPSNNLPYEDEKEAHKREVAKWTIHYINEYRKSEGKAPATMLPGMTLVAEYRADQLTTNYGHDTDDERTALAYYKYGEWLDATEFGGKPEESYYQYDGGEAISRGGIFGETAEEQGKSIAEVFYNSKNHWSYLGDPQYPYIAVGVEYGENEREYCCVMVSATNHDIGWVNPHK